MRLKTLKDAAKRYRLRDAAMSNDELAGRLGLKAGLGDERGMPNCCFYLTNIVVGIRTTESEIVIFLLYQSVQKKLEEFAERIISDEEAAEASYL